MIENRAVVDTPMGRLGISWKDDMLTRVDLEPETLEQSGGRPPTVVAEQLDAYFRDGSTRLDLPVELVGTPFQRRVWRTLRHIAPGKTITYGELAKQLGTSARAIGGACRANPLPVLVPCHRVVAVKGLGGFAGDASGRKLEVKRWLLRHEDEAVSRS
jgi:methylated-DNA-[protein]-cysteine S-methyltransferase